MEETPLKWHEILKESLYVGFSLIFLGIYYAVIFPFKLVELAYRTWISPAKEYPFKFGDVFVSYLLLGFFYLVIGVYFLMATPYFVYRGEPLKPKNRKPSMKSDPNSVFYKRPNR